MARFNPYIAGFYLLLSLTFVLPVRHMHVCEEEAAGHCQNHLDEEGISSFHEQCALCDLVFSPSLSPEDIIELKEPILLGQHAAIVEERPANISLPFIHLRAPPLG